MRTYGFDFLRGDGGIAAVDVGEFTNDDEAVRQARCLLQQHVTADDVNIWVGPDLVARLRRDIPGPHS